MDLIVVLWLLLIGVFLVYAVIALVVGALLNRRLRRTMREAPRAQVWRTKGYVQERDGRWIATDHVDEIASAVSFDLFDDDV